MSHPDIRLDALVSALARVGIVEPATGVEVGVWKADMSVAMLKRWPGLHLTCVDPWRPYLDGWEDWSAETMAGLKVAALARLAPFGKRVRLLEMPSVEASRACKGEHFDFVFIDGDHAFDACLTDCRAWWPRVRPGGLLCGHDYGQDEIPPFGVTEAVFLFCMARGLGFWQGDEFTWFIRKP